MVTAPCSFEPALDLGGKLDGDLVEEFRVNLHNPAAARSHRKAHRNNEMVRLVSQDLNGDEEGEEQFVVLARHHARLLSLSPLCCSKKSGTAKPGKLVNTYQKLHHHGPRTSHGICSRR